ncbi:diguanylate cyclase [Herbaspirillum hiltneri N3]|uniref:diguanylate cyclase n=1 Tax=Herbaspirillum hiltneri N3 TaxID=1262470 RepID=A0ABM5V4G0_9BURK|nr:sensor domain-containing diguanylate cyclase [Herbaspirillum hiltneri]AKZ64523.1 diguanylate cyclase [Herbaspirillum hiltneri N3]
MRKMLDLLSLKLLRRIEIRYRLINSFLLVSMLPLVIAGIVAYRESSSASQEKVRIFAAELVKQVAQNMLQQIEKIESSSEELAMSERMQNALAGYYSKNPAERAAGHGEIIRLLLENYGSFEYVNQKYVLDRRHRIMDPQVFAQLGDGVARFAEDAPDMKGRPYWDVYSTAAGQNSVVMLRDILFKSNNRVAGTLFVGLRPLHFSRIFESVNLGYGSRMLVIDARDGHVIVSANAADGNAPESGLVVAVARNVAEGRDNFVSYRDGDNKQQLAAFAPVPHTNWMVVNITPLNALNTEVRSIRNKIIAIGVLCFILALVLSFIIARSISLPLKQLVGVMKATRTGNYLIRMDYEGRDEIAVLSQRFNEMASKVHQHNERLEELVAERTRELEQANHQLEALSATDSLTGIANRRRFDEALGGELRRAVRSQKPLALMMLDVDYFKNYNDRYGHLAGDDCLRAIARVLRTSSRRATDLAARYGGEEFAVIVAESDSANAMQLAENIRNAVAALQIAHEDSPFGCVTCSIGVTAVQVDEDMSTDTLLRLADVALYQAKALGRNRVALSDPAGATG